MLVSAPEGYQKIHREYALKGARVLALAYKFMPSMSIKAIKDLDREKAECDLIFAGFLILSCPLKPDAEKSLLMLTQSSHRVLMITGDNALTACHVAKEVHIVKRSVLIMDVRPNVAHVHSLKDLQWSTPDETMQRPVEEDPKHLLQTFWDNDVCLTGHALSTLAHKSGHLKIKLGEYLAHVRVFARTSPQEKVRASLKKKNNLFIRCRCRNSS